MNELSASSSSSVPCPRCGRGNRDTAKFCKGCGLSFAPEITCVSCGSKLEADAVFCDECGTAVTASQPAVKAPVRESARLPETFGGGRYKVVRFLGEGGRKRVYLAEDTRLTREVAVSVFKAEGVDETALIRARREAEAMGKLGDHPNIVTIYDFGEEDGGLFLVSQYMSGGDLSGMLSQAPDRRLAIAEVARISTEIARGLEHAHANGVIHRDLKPQNVWLSPDGTAKLGDFGLALAADRSRLTVDGAMVGTVAYMPPEQGLGRPADERSDLYSLGAVMYELICGVPPFTGGDAAAIISQHVSTVPVGPSWHRSDLPTALERLVLKLLAKTPDERFQSATETREALQAIESASGVAPAPAEGTVALERLTDGIFLGRESEMKELRAALDESIAGRGHVTLIAGDAGIGKTRLATEVKAYAELRGARVLSGRCHAGEGAPPYWPWVQVIRTYVRERKAEELLAELGSGATDIAQVVSDVRACLPDLPEPQVLDPDQARFRLFDAVTTFLRNASSTGPLAIFIEDLHRADEPSRELLDFVSRELGGARIFLLGTYRDTELGEDHALNELHASLSRERNYSRLRLRGLNEREVKALLEDVSRQTLETTQELALVDAVFRESDGNPFFIEEILRTLLESEVIYLREGKWVSDATHMSDLSIPKSIRELVEQRLARLPEESRELLSIASVIGYEFDMQTLETVAGIPVASVFDRVRAAVDAAIVSPVPDEPNRYRFAYGATRDALYEELPESRRFELHRAIGEALEEMYDDRIESHLAELAHHFALAAPLGLAGKAADYSWWAGERAATLAAHEEAVLHFTRTIQLFDTLTEEEPTRRCELLIVLGESRWRAGDVRGAKETFLKAAEAAEKHALRDQYARAALGFAGGPGGFSAADKPDDQLVELLRTALRGLSERDSLLRVRLLARLSLEMRLTTDAVEPDKLSREALEMAERLGDARITLLAMYSRQWATMGPDGLEDDLTAGEEIVRLARVVGDKEMDFHGHHLRIHGFLALGDMVSVDREIRSCEKLARELRQPYYEWHVAVFRVMRALMQGRFDEAGRLASSAAAIGARSQPEIATTVFGVHALLGSLHTNSMADLVPGGELFATNYPHSAWPSAYAWILTEVGENAKARPVFDGVARDRFAGLRRDSNWLTAMTCGSLACSALGDEEAAAVMYELLSPYADYCTSILTAAAFVGSIHMYLGFLAETMRHLDTAIDHFQKGIEVNERIGAYLLVPRTYFGLARALLARDGAGDRERASQAIEKGLDRAREVQMPGEVERLLGLKLGGQGITSIDTQASIYLVAKSVEQARPDLTRAVAPDGTVTIMFSDIEDSTVLTERLGDRQWLELLEGHNQIIRENCAKHDGYTVKSQGDGFMLAFASARKAIHCAIDVQRAMAEHRGAHPEAPLKVRIGLHTGETLRSEEDFFGKNVILAARIAAQATGDQILVSWLLRELVSSTGEFGFGNERELELKGLSGSYRVFEVQWDGATAPGAAPAVSSPRS